jgi:hypothetical protein
LCRRLGVPLSVALIALLGFAPSAFATDPPSGVNIGLAGCDLTQSNGDPQSYNPDAVPPDLVCDDKNYVGGNLGKAWNELDLVPFRVEAKAGNSAPSSSTYDFAIVVDASKAGVNGYDVLGEPVLNIVESSPGCTLVSVSGEQHLVPGLGGVSDSLYRVVRLTQPRGTTCVLDYYARLAVGSHLFPGSSLHGNLALYEPGPPVALDSGGIGSQDRSIPVNEIAPQELAKDMTATQGSDHVWDITKSPTPANVSFNDTCDPSLPHSAGVAIKITWERKAATPSGPITVITHVYATNPAARIVTVNVTDVIQSGTTGLDTTSSGPVDVPKNTANFLVLTHQTTVPAGTTDLNDVATAAYTDKVTGIPVPGTTTATASAPVQLSGVEKNQTATVKDSESITGSGLKFSADSFTPDVGDFDAPYVAGSSTVGPVGWTSDIQSGSGNVTFSKTIYVDTGTATSTGKLSDTATLTGSDGFSATADAHVDVTSSAKASLKIAKTIPNILQGSESQTFTFDVYAFADTELVGGDRVPKSGASPVATKSLTFNAGETSKNDTATGLTPGKYVVFERPSAGWTAQDPQEIDLSLPTCSATASFDNTFGPANAKAVKVTVPAGSEAGWDMTLNGPGAGAGGETVTTGSNGEAVFTTALQEGSYTITETAKSGWDQTDAQGCSFTVNYPADFGKTFTCTITNTQRGRIIVKKVTKPSGASQKFAFTGDLAGSIGDGEQIAKEVKPGTYSTTEAVAGGWDLTDISCDDGNSSGDKSTGVASYDVSPGETVTCTYTNTQRGSIKVVKKTNPSGSAEKFSFSGDLTGSIGDGESIGPKEVKPGTYSTTEAPKTGWDLTSVTCDDGSSATPSVGDKANSKATFKVDPGENVTCTFTNRQRGKAKVVKTVKGAPPSGDQAFTFQLRQGASPIAVGTTLEQLVANAANGGLLSFTTYLVPGDTYQLCEIVQPGWLSNIGSFVPNSFNPPDGVAPNPNVDNSIVCIDFTVTAGETKTFNVDNTPPPGGRALTIGFWKNWSSCTGGGQKPTLDQTLAKLEPTGLQVGDIYLHGSTLTPNKAPDCQQAVNLLAKTTIDGKKKMASDPIFNLAAQYVAAKLNIGAGAGTNGNVLCNITSAQLLMDAVDFNGLTHLALTAAQTTKANALAQLLDDYNNDRPVTSCVAYP